MPIYIFENIFWNHYKRKVDITFSKKLNVVNQGKNNWKKGKNARLSISF